MSAQVYIRTVEAQGQTIRVTGGITLTGSYVAGGDPLNFTGGGTLPALQDPAFVGLIPAAISSNLTDLTVASQGGNLVNNFVATLTKTGTPATCNPATGAKLKICAASSFGTEFTAGAYSAALLADNIAFEATFIKLL